MDESTEQPTRRERIPGRRTRTAPGIGLMALSVVVVLAQVLGAAGRLRQQAARRAEQLESARLEIAAAQIAGEAAATQGTDSATISPAARAALDAQATRLAQRESLAAGLASAQAGSPIVAEPGGPRRSLLATVQFALGPVLFAAGVALLLAARREALAARGPTADRAR